MSFTAYLFPTTKPAFFGGIWGLTCSWAVITLIEKHVTRFPLLCRLAIKLFLYLLYGMVFDWISQFNSIIIATIALPAMVVILTYNNPEVQIFLALMTPILILVIGVLSFIF